MRRYSPRRRLPAAPSVFFLHGGYGVFGDLDLQDGFCRRLATGLAAEVTSVAYPLAPEHTFTESIHAVSAVLRTHGRGTMVVWGDSAGGALALAVTASARRHDDEHSPAALILTNPNIDLTLATVDERAPAGPDLDLSRRAFRAWLPEPHEAADLTLLAPHLPPTFVAVGTEDALRPEAHALQAACLRAGTPCALLELEGIGHGLVGTSQSAALVIRGARGFLHEQTAIMPQS